MAASRFLNSSLLLLHPEVAMLISSLISVEKSKFQRGRGSKASRTDRSSQITPTGEQITGQLITVKDNIFIAQRTATNII
eukprot:scaffold27056_cov140-Skeletonema_menzelii.AAC.4